MEVSVGHEVSYRPKTLPPLQKMSYSRILRDTVAGIAIWIIRSLQSIFASKPSIDIRSYSEHKDYPAIFSLKNAKLIGNATVLSYLQKLENLQIDTSLLLGQALACDQLRNWVAIPIILKGLFRDHIVTILVNKENKTIEFYDSKGLTIKDQARRELRFPSESLTTLEDHVNAIWETFQADASWTFKENTTRHQTDAYNCGVFVSNFIQRRLSGSTFESIERNGLSFQEACGSAREEMIRTLLS